MKVLLILTAVFLTSCISMEGKAELEDKERGEIISIMPEEIFHNITVNGIGMKIRVLQRKGPGRMLFFIHGWLHSAERWLPLMNSLPEEFDLISIELPGFGKSVISDPERAKISLYSAAVKEIIKLYFNPLKRPILIAHSLGGLISLSFSETEFSDIIFIGTPAFGLNGILSILQHRNITTLNFNLNKNLPEYVSTYFIKKFGEITVNNPVYIDELMVNDVTRANTEVSSLLAREISLYNISEQDKIYRGNSHVIQASRDKIVSNADSEKLAEYLGAPLYVIENSGHTIMTEAVEELKDIILTIIQNRSNH